MSEFTVYERIHEGKRMNEARDKILSILKESNLSIIDEIMVLEMLAFDRKFKVSYAERRSLLNTDDRRNVGRDVNE